VGGGGGWGGEKKKKGRKINSGNRLLTVDMGRKDYTKKGKKKGGERGKTIPGIVFCEVGEVAKGKTQKKKGGGGWIPIHVLFSLGGEKKKESQKKGKTESLPTLTLQKWEWRKRGGSRGGERNGGGGQLKPRIVTGAGSGGREKKKRKRERREKKKGPATGLFSISEPSLTKKENPVPRSSGTEGKEERKKKRCKRGGKKGTKNGILALHNQLSPP